jgi:hypothetical protein
MIAIRLDISWLRAAPACLTAHAPIGPQDHGPRNAGLICYNGRAAPPVAVSANKEIAMTYKTILVHLDSGKRCPARLELGIRLAKSFDAHLVGLHA